MFFLFLLVFFSLFSIVLLFRFRLKLTAFFLFLFSAYHLSFYIINPDVKFDFYFSVMSTFFISFLVFVMFNLLIIYPLRGKSESISFSLVDNKYIKRFAFIVSFFSIVTMIFVFFAYGVPLLELNIRYTVSSYQTYLIYMLWMIYPYVYFTMSKDKNLLYLVMAVAAFLLMGYRTPIAILFLEFFTLNVLRQRFKMSVVNKFFVLFVTFLILVIYPKLRYSDEYITELASNVNIPDSLIFISPLLFASFEANEVVNGIEEITREQGFKYGAFTLNGFLTFLPGEQISSSRELSIWLGRDNWETSTTIPTLLGQFYLEIGWLGVFFLSFILALFMVYIDLLRYKKNNIYTLSIMAMLYSSILISIHTGFIDTIYIYAIIVNVLFLLVSQFRYLER